jgi:Ala-tRNA(Pro) deacylase
MSISTRLKHFLDQNQIPYSVMTHSTAYTAQGAAVTMQISGKELAKAVVLWAGEDMILAVLPASNHVRLDQLAAELGKPVRLASEQEFCDRFPDCELGAMPPFGSLYNLPVYVDESLAADEMIVFNAGTHRDAIRMRYGDFVGLAKPKVCSFAKKA